MVEYELGHIVRNGCLIAPDKIKEIININKTVFKPASFGSLVLRHFAALQSLSQQLLNPEKAGIELWPCRNQARTTAKRSGCTAQLANREMEKDKPVFASASAAASSPNTASETQDDRRLAPSPPSITDVGQAYLQQSLQDIEKHTGKDVILIRGALDLNLSVRARLALEHLNPKQGKTLLVILDTPGGYIVNVKTIVQTLRNFYSEVHFLVPVMAMSAGTVLVMSGDEIYMDYFSYLGPIDPQIERGGRLVSALSYLRQYEEMKEKPHLSMAEHQLLEKLDLAELEDIKLSVNLSVALITEWLSKYKFKNWKKNNDVKKQRAQEIAAQLNNQDKWFVHSHGIHMDVLENDLKLKINDYGADSKLKDLVWRYFRPAIEVQQSMNLDSFCHHRIKT